MSQSGSSGWLQVSYAPHGALQDACYYAYFAPYSYKRHQDLIAETLCHDQARLFMIGETLDGGVASLLVCVSLACLLNGPTSAQMLSIIQLTLSG